MKRILIAEDEKMIRYGIRVMIEGSGIPYREIIECKNGKEAIGYLKTNRVDLVITDIRMPFMDGVELVFWMQEHLEKEAIPLIVAISGYSDFEYARSMLKAGAINYLLKPIDREELANSLWQAETMLRSRNVLQSDEPEESKENMTYVNKKKMEDAIDYVRKNYKKHIDMAEVSNHVSMNYTMFSSVFCKYTGMNFTVYLRKVRIDKAKKLLHNTDMKVKEICQEVGSDDMAHFTRLFKEETGKTPNAYRKEI